ncbi:MAG: tRNA 5-methoxyuridine(34)/uridine 5-oxyacetic acid(34) synthase CmoB [Woeseiaceae bacterium]
MIDYDALWRCCSDIGVGSWREQTEALIQNRLSDAAHGDFAIWRATIERLRSLDSSQTQDIRDALMSLSPWRKGPFELAGISIDSEWRSDLKWARLKDAIAPLAGRNVLDVGCGNGYYAQQMQAAGAKAVIGVDPTLLYVMQFLAVNHFAPAENVFVLPLRSGELPQNDRAFDSCFSMGVLYHQRSPIDHLRQLKGMLRPGGQLVLETIFVPGEESYACTPADRYARMRNVWLLPTISELKTWLSRSGFKDIAVIDQSVTGIDEQRSTEWMTFESLAEALDPSDSSKTIEGWPAPRRVIVLANAP